MRAKRYILNVRVRPVSPFWKLQFAGWTAFYIAMALSRMGRVPLDYMLVNKVPLTLYGLLASLALRAMLRPLLARQASMIAVVGLCVVASYVISVVWTVAFNLTVITVIDPLFGGDSEIKGAFLLSGAIYHAFSMVAWGFLYIGIKHHHAWQRERENALRADALATKARLNALQHQLNPHFFLNSLNAVSTLVAERRNDEATTMIARLGEFLRATLGRDGAAHVTLHDELGYVERYLDIERARFEDRLEVRFAIDPSVRDASVPLLILQPLVENAIRHGIAKLREGGYVSVAARRTGGAPEQLEITIENSAPEVDGKALTLGIGLEHVRQRLTMLYNNQQRFVAERRPRAFSVRLQMPLTGVTAPASAEQRAVAVI